MKKMLKDRKKNTQNTFIVVLSVLKFVLGNVQKECLITENLVLLLHDIVVKLIHGPNL